MFGYVGAQDIVNLRTLGAPAQHLGVEVVGVEVAAQHVERLTGRRLFQPALHPAFTGTLLRGADNPHTLARGNLQRHTLAASALGAVLPVVDEDGYAGRLDSEPAVVNIGQFQFHCAQFWGLSYRQR